MTIINASMISALLVASLSNAVMADTLYINTTGNGNVGIGSRADWAAALGNSVAAANSFTNGTPAGGGSEGHTNGTIHFISGVMATISTIGTPADGGFYLGNIDVGTRLNNGYFDAGDAARPTNNPLAVAFGNSDHFLANALQIIFNPGVSGFGFNFDDIGDVGAVLEIIWSDGKMDRVTLGAIGGPRIAEQDGFFGLIRSEAMLTSISLVQIPGVNNDGFTLYDLTVSTSVVPLPPAAFAGLAGLASVAFISRRRNNKAATI